MRKIPKLKNPNHIEREFVINSFKPFTASAQNLSADDGGLCVKQYLAELGISAPYGIEKLYFVNGKYFVYSSLGYFYQWLNNAWQSVLESDRTPYVVGARIDGQDCVLVAGDGAIMIKPNGTVQAITLPQGDCGVVYKSMLFVANGNKLCFSKVANYLEFASGLTNGGYLLTDKSQGDIVALIPTDDCLVVVCEKTVYHLVAVGDRMTYVLNKQDLSLNVAKGSVSFAGDSIYFISDNLLCSLKGQSLKHINLKTNLDLMNFYGQAGSDGAVYYARYKDVNDNVYAIFYNALDQTENLVKLTSPALADGGVILDNYKLKKLSAEYSPDLRVKWNSVKINFGSPLTKALTAISMQANYTTYVKVKGEYGEQNFVFLKGFSRHKCNIISNAYELEITGISQDFKVDKILFNYYVINE